MMKRVLIYLRNLILFFFISSILAVVLYRFVPVYLTPLMVIRLVEQAKAGKNLKLEHEWVPIEKIAQTLPQAVVASEDNLFMEHPGFDFKQIQKAREEAEQGKRVRGASTISQQTAKNVFLWPGRSWIRKGLEAYFTVLIEFMWPKERILEVYLNSIEMGAGIYGVEAAAEHYFDCTAGRLSKRQCALIAVSLPAPLKRDPAHPSAYLNRRVATISKFM